MYHVFLDFENIDDHLNVYSKCFLTFGENHIMKILRWTTDFKPEAKSTLAPFGFTSQTFLGIIMNGMLYVVYVTYWYAAYHG